MSNNIIDRSNVKKYFRGSIGPIVLIVIGLLLIIVTFGLLLIAGVIWYFVDKYTGNSETEREIDKIIEVETQRLKKRGMEKLNIVDEQIGLIPPICLNGPSYDPNPDGKSTFSRSAKSSIWGRFFSKNDDPIWKTKIGSDGKWRYSLIEINVFMFDEGQMFLYYAYLDITTGLIFEEGTHEYFYCDVVAISTNQVLSKVLNPRKKKYERRLFEYIMVYTSGCSHKASISTELNASLIDTQFTAMRNLIRDKKGYNLSQV